ncbi:MAG: hypothetical protein ACLSVG_01510 [Clostridia bacterium]
MIILYLPGCNKPPAPDCKCRGRQRQKIAAMTETGSVKMLLIPNVSTPP